MIQYVNLQSKEGGGIMYVYSVGIVDHFNGLTHLSDYIDAVKEGGGDAFAEPRDDLDSLKSFVAIALWSALDAEDGIPWEGDLRGDAIFIGGIPSGNHDLICQRFLVIKQDNNGSTFLISPIAFDHLNEHLIGSSSDVENLDLDVLPSEVSEIIDTHFK